MAAAFSVAAEESELAVGRQVQMGLQGACRRYLNMAADVNYSVERGEYSTCCGNTGQVPRMFVR